MAYLQMMVYCYWSQKRVLMIAPCTMSHFGVYKLPVAFVCVCDDQYITITFVNQTSRKQNILYNSPANLKTPPNPTYSLLVHTHTWNVCQRAFMSPLLSSSYIRPTTGPITASDGRSDRSLTLTVPTVAILVWRQHEARWTSPGTQTFSTTRIEAGSRLHRLTGYVWSLSGQENREGKEHEFPAHET